MNCVSCGKDANYRDRTNGKCPSCGQRFAFEPRQGDKVTDMVFWSAIERVSSHGQVKWTRQNLYYEVARRLRKRGQATPWLLALLAFLSLVFAIAFSMLILIATWLFAAGALHTRKSKYVALTSDEFDNLWTKWVNAHGQPEGLIVRRAPPPTARARAIPSDIHHYSFDRAVVSDRAETVDVLLANNFHFENNCAVLSAHGYPEEAFDTVLAMLRKNPKLTVYVLHDVTVEGCLLAGELRKRGWFAESARIIDVGLHVEQGRRYTGSFKPIENGALMLTDRTSFTKDEAEWLMRHSLDLMVLRPEQIVKRLFRALSNEKPLTMAPGGGYEIDKTSFGSAATTSDGGGDSFG